MFRLGLWVRDGFRDVAGLCSALSRARGSDSPDNMNRDVVRVSARANSKNPMMSFLKAPKTII